MKKRIKFLILFVLLLLPVSVNALEGTVTVDCALDEAKPGDEIICNIDGTSSPTGITQFKANLVVSDGLKIKDQRDTGDDIAKYIVLKNGWQGGTDLHPTKDDANVNIGLYKGDPTASGTTFSIFSIRVIVKDNAVAGNQTITLNNVHFYYDDDGGKEDVDVSSSSATINVIKNDEPVNEENPDLKELYVSSGGIMSPTFSKDALTYAIRLNSADTTKFNLNAIAEDDKYSITAKNSDTGDNIDLSKEIAFLPKEDSETMSIKITVSYGEKSKDYVLIIDRPKPSGVGQPTLASLIVGGVSIDLKSGKYDYSVSLNKSILKSYKIFATLSDSDNFKFSDYTKSILDTNKSDAFPFEIQILPKDSNSGYGSNNYIITIVEEDGDNNSGSGSNTGTNNGNDVNSSPQTGVGSGIVMGIVLILSFIGSLYYYKKNISEYE